MRVLWGCVQSTQRTNSFSQLSVNSALTTLRRERVVCGTFFTHSQSNKRPAEPTLPSVAARGGSCFVRCVGSVQISMETVIAILSIVLAALGIIATYHIARRQGVFRRDNLVLTVAQPTPHKKGEPFPKHTKVFKVGNLSQPESGYPFLLRMPLLVTFGIPSNEESCVVFLLVTLINRKSHPVSDVSIHMYVPAKWMPDSTLEFSPPKGLQEERTIDEATKEGHIRYKIDRLAQSYCEVIAAPLILPPNDIIRDDAEHGALMSDKLHSIRFILQTTTLLIEEKMWLVPIRSDDIRTLVGKSTWIANELLKNNLSDIRKPLMRKLLWIPYAYRAVLCVQPDLRHPRALKGLTVHSFQRAGDKTESVVVGIVI